MRSFTGAMAVIVLAFLLLPLAVAASSNFYSEMVHARPKGLRPKR